MSLVNYSVVLACVIGICAGQILFKLTAASLVNTSRLWQVFVSPTLLLGLGIYGLATIAWIMQLRHIDLSRAYPFMALSFVLVPLASVLFLKEAVDGRYWVGVGFIVSGIVLTVAR